ncbi:unnamed protein product, partial [Meganyctiphanes norvegica]
QDAGVGPRSSRDIETETDEILLVETSCGGGGGGGGGSSSLGSSASLVSATSDDKSISADNIEELKSDVPFAGLFRGSVTPMDGDILGCLDRPRSLTTPATLTHRITSADKGTGTRNSGSMSPGGGTMTGPSGGGSGGSLLSPLDEAEEWARINDIMASFGSGLARESVFMAELEHEFQTRLGLSLSPSQQGLRLLAKSPIPDEVDANQDVTDGGELTMGAWLTKLGLQQYEDVFLAHGYDTTLFMNGGILDRIELQEMGITNVSVKDTLVEAITKLPTPLHHSTYILPDTLDKWLASVHLPQYENHFNKNGFGDMERVKKVWEIELTAVLEISRPGHRKRILASLGERPIEPELPPQLNPHDLSLELSKLNSDISQLKEQLFNELPSSQSRERRPPETATNTIRRSGTKKRSAPQPPKAPRAQPSLQTAPSTEELDALNIREPNQLVVGVPNNNLTAWRHHPHALVQNSVQYVAQYLGSTHVKELKGTESTMKSIQKLKKSTAEGAKVPRIILSVSYKGVKFIDAVTQSLVCQHEIRNIHCACQDADDLSHFAYITKDIETKGHYCHIFRVQSRELATEIILTLGEAFEVAYQLALKEHTLEQNQSDEQKLLHGHSRSKSELGIRTKSALSNGATSQHTRSHSTVQAQSSISGVSSSSLDNLLSDSGNGSEKENGSRRGSIGSYITSHGGSPSSSSNMQMNGT